MVTYLSLLIAIIWFNEVGGQPHRLVAIFSLMGI